MRPSLIAAALASLLLVSCNVKPATAPELETTTFAASLEVNLAVMTKTNSGMYYSDGFISVAGAVAAVGDSVGIYYSGYLVDGYMFDQVVAPAAPYKFWLGGGNVIPAWDEAVVGMHVGGQRKIVVPPHLAYGAVSKGKIAANSNLVFNLELRSVKKNAAAVAISAGNVAVAR